MNPAHTRTFGFAIIRDPNQGRSMSSHHERNFHSKLAIAWGKFAHHNGEVSLFDPVLGKGSTQPLPALLIVGKEQNTRGIQIQSMHHAHTPEIEITSEVTAKGTWYLEDFVLSALPSGDWAPDGTVMHGTGIYYDEYAKIDGTWMVAKTGYERIFEDLQPRGKGSRLRTRWDKKKR